MPDNENQKRLKKQIKEATEVLLNIFHLPTPAIGLDLDGCIDEAPHLFQVLSSVWPGKVYVITYRTDQEKAEQDVASFGVKCDEVILVSSFAEKRISVYVDDQDEILMHVPEGVTVLKFRNGGNYDYEERKWLYSEETGTMI